MCRLPPCTATIVLLAAMLLAGGCSRTPDLPRLMASASRHQAGGDNRAAIIELKSALQQAPTHAAARMQLGDVYLESGDVLSAEKEFRRAQEAGAPPAMLLPRLATVLLQQQRYQQVLAELPGPGAAPPPAEQAEAEALRGYALLGLQRGAEAADAFARVLGAHPGHASALLGQARMALQAGDAVRAMQAVSAVVAAHPGHVEALRLLGDLHRRAGNVAPALESYREAIRQRPGYLQARLDAAALLAAGDRVDEARKELAQAARIAPGSAAVIYTQALLALQEKQYPAALERLLQILRAAPDHPPSNFLAAGIYLAQNNLSQAELHVQRFLAAHPRHVPGIRLAAGIALRSGKAAQAAALLEPLLESHPDDADLHAAAGEAYMRLQAYDKASACFDKASAKGMPSVALRTAQAITELGLGANQRAAAVLEQLLQSAPGSSEGAQQRAGALLVVAHMRAGDYGKALAAAESLEQRHDNPALQNLKGGVHLARNDPDRARQAFEAAVRLQPGYLPALQNLAQLDLLAGQPDQAARRYQAALAHDTGNSGIMMALGRLAAQRGQLQAARGWLERAHQAAPEALAPALQLAAWHLHTGEAPKALALAQKLQAANPASTEALAMLAAARSASRDLEGALESYTSLAGLQPENTTVLLQLAGAHMALERPADALAAVRKALAVQPEHGAALATAVRLLMDSQAWDQALALARPAQARPASAALGYRLEADVEMARARPAAALPLYRKAWALEPGGPLAISLHRALAANGKPGEAQQLISRWLDSRPRDLPTRLYLASTLVAAADYHAAIGHFEQVLAAEPNHVVALNDLAWCYQQAGDRRALSLAEKAHALAPANPAVADTLGWILAQQGQPARAVPLLRAATGQAPHDGDIRLRYASALLGAGERGEARRQLLRLQSDSGFKRQAEVRALLARL